MNNGLTALSLIMSHKCIISHLKAPCIGPQKNHTAVEKRSCCACLQSDHDMISPASNQLKGETLQMGEATIHQPITSTATLSLIIMYQNPLIRGQYNKQHQLRLHYTCKFSHTTVLKSGPILQSISCCTQITASRCTETSNTTF